MEILATSNITLLYKLSLLYYALTILALSDQTYKTFPVFLGALG